MAMPELDYQPAPCPQCGAVDADDAENKCQATQGMDGDYHCAGGDCCEDSAGRFLFPTAASLARLDAWYHQKGLADDLAETGTDSRDRTEVSASTTQRSNH